MKHLNIVFTLLAVSISIGSSQYISVETQISGILPDLGGEDLAKRYDAQKRLKRAAAESAIPGRESERKEFTRAVISFLDSTETPAEAKVWLIRQLQLVGDDSAVPSLTKLLNGSDTRLREAARLALEKNPSGAESLRAALGAGKGGVDFQVGLANSLGEICDRDAVEALTKMLAHEDLRTVSAASTALGKIATEEAKNALFATLDNSPYDGPRKLAVARGLLEAAESTRDMTFLSALASIDMPGAVSSAAAAAEVRVQPELASGLLADALVNHSTDRATAIILAVEDLPNGKAILEGGLESFPKTLEQNKPVLFEALGRNRITRAISRLGEALNSGSAPLREVALRALANIGTSQSLEAILTFAASEDRNVQRAAMGAIAESTAPVEKPLADLAASDKKPVRILSVGALVARGDRSSTPLFIEALKSDDKDLRSTGAAGMSALGGAGNLAELIGLLQAGNKEVGPAIVGIAWNAGDSDAVTRILADGLKVGDGVSSGILFAAVAAAGAPSGLELLSKNARVPGELRDGAIRALAKWPTADAVGPLIAVASDPGTSEAHYKIAMDALARLLRTEQAGSKGERVAAVSRLLESGRNLQSKQLMISVLGSIKHNSSRKALEKLKEDPNLKADAEQALKNIGKK